MLSESAVSAIREGTGHLDTAKDLAQLGAMFGSNWERVATVADRSQHLLSFFTMLASRSLSEADTLYSSGSISRI